MRSKRKYQEYELTAVLTTKAENKAQRGEM